MGCDDSKDRPPGQRSISIHAPTWGATTDFYPFRAFKIISIHAPTWGATGDIWQRMADLGISIHAPTWGATLKPLHQAAGISYFNPRTHVGCDISFHSAHLTAFYFNPRTHVGCDLNRLVQRVAVGEISIHAPTWGATQRHQPRLSGAVYFNPRTHVGCDGVNTGIAVWDSEFQSTHPRGVRLGSPNLPNLSEVFQSTHPRGVRRTRRSR